MQEFRTGCSRALGVGVGYVPIAISFGALATQSGLSDAAAVVMSVWVYAGAAQFAALEGIRQNLSWLSIVLTMLLMNLRHIPISLAINPIFNRFDRKQQLFLAHGLTDEAFALDVSDKPRSWHYYTGIHLFCWLSWILGTWIGCQLGQQIPAQWLQFALPSLFICLLIDNIKTWNQQIILTILTGVVLVLTLQNIGTLGILISILGVAALATLQNQ
ncbi:AzlC family ABC transporter permease [Gloeocapsopsis dulcis]|uniref:AzlC family protein n=1 Tax=Gloeocapsopsis dulcis AAB1 = 1H9 TaxID=1433147 RepID=A0A6N8FS77_9CHRO|nr:AzlC family ABC transporter permease [Gloeocapsopsis dulcis]MUL35943.1 AzlC family protein [Gloeocapsopsis dulcis AAB1 = 1H9]WNN88198.1 AzlC family ABC transporter permease [Gloeocapsopsis dulcis]